MKIGALMARVSGLIVLGDKQVDIGTCTIIERGAGKRVEARLIEVLCCLVEANGRVVSRDELVEKAWSGRFVGDDAIASTVSRLRSALGDTEKKLIQTVPKRGYRLVTRPKGGGDLTSLCARGEASLTFWTSDAMRFAVSCFDAVCAIEPANARALAGRALANASLRCWGADDATAPLSQARDDAQIAVSSAPLLANSWLARAAVSFLDCGDFREIRAMFARSLELDQYSVVSHLWGALIFSAAGKFDEAVHEATKAVKIEPMSAPVRSGLVQTLLYSRRYLACVAEADGALELFPGALGILAHKGLALLLSGAETEAMRVMASSWRAGVGRQEKLEELARAFNQGGVSAYFGALASMTSSDHERDTVRPVDRACLWALAGDKVRALKALDLAVARADLRLRWIGVLPHLDTLRGERAFDALCAEHAPFASEVG
jgi:hypothetical protein